MTQYNTGNPVPSSAMPDIWDNNATIDEFVNSPELTLTTRTGTERDTLAGIQKKSDDQRVQMAEDGAAVVEETRQNLIPLSRQYMTLDAAQADIANIPVGSTIYVRSQDGSALADEYMNVAGTLTATGRKMPSQAAVDEISDRIPYVPSTSAKVPLFVDEDDNVPVWLEGGKLNAAGLSDELRDVSDTDYAPKVPLFVDEDDNVPVWLEDGKLNAVKLHEDLTDGFLTYSQLNDFLVSKILNTSGSTIWKFRAKKAKLDLGISSRLKIGFTGDSWTEHNTIPQVFADYFYEKYGKSGDGWIQLNIDNPNQLNGITLSRSGWSIYDASTTSSNPTFPTAMDGQYIYSNGTSATLSIGNLFDTSVQIFYYDGTGTFRYSVNGGTPVVVTGAGTNKIVSVTVSGLTSSSATTLSLDLVGNAGTVVIYGFYANGTGNGVEINKMGNGGITAPQYTKTLPYLSQTGTVVAPDVLIMIIGTNDYRTSVSLDDFRDGLTQWLAAWKAIVPDSGIIMIAPAQCNATGSNPLSSFRNVMREVAVDNGVEFYSLYDFMNTTYAKSNAEGMWVDGLHLSNAGARFFLNQINHYFFGG
ncbi:flagellar biosynthesis, cell-distal portion of basal-body rod [Klebsiella pneumoniae]|uniref:SGNH/GDSL hydrolase family protein n=1 Tax=Klebsiella pneumoniae TaxID=573 RepID=UPI0010840D8B|nr:SGNH/GDSL hydrolase family protein [Klebsiella pneumoniae]VFZ93381.1 flagellar biosynthesis, cell-distal portion of basal-body rod [Klebsiella pneumoniae]VGA28503.1 flagellar biosynthesis, cell-distal portion of basal-body rod [Klebsiella pneumoniae]